MLCASKVASTTGDLRTVFDVCRYDSVLLSLSNRSSSDFFSQSMELAVESPMKANVGVTQMMEVFTTSHQNTNSSDHVQTKSLPTFEKLLLCSLIVCMRSSKKRICTRAKVREVYRCVHSTSNEERDAEARMSSVLSPDRVLEEIFSASHRFSSGAVQKSEGLIVVSRFSYCWYFTICATNINFHQRTV
jgi:Cdc6-like AAA superfamily ATPase